MPCSCGTKKPVANTVSYVHTSPDGEKRTYKSEVEAAAAVKRLGGVYRPS